MSNQRPPAACADREGRTSDACDAYGQEMRAVQAHRDQRDKQDLRALHGGSAEYAYRLGGESRGRVYAAGSAFAFEILCAPRTAGESRA